MFKKILIILLVFNSILLIGCDYQKNNRSSTNIKASTNIIKEKEVKKITNSEIKKPEIKKQPVSLKIESGIMNTKTNEIIKQEKNIIEQKPKEKIINTKELKENRTNNIINNEKKITSQNNEKINQRNKQIDVNINKPIKKPEIIVEKKENKKPAIKEKKNLIIFPNGREIKIKIASGDIKIDQKYIDTHPEATTWFTAPNLNIGDNKNTYIAAHTKIFKDMFSLHIGDRIIIYDSNGNKGIYQVKIIDEMNDDLQSRKNQYIYEKYIYENSSEMITLQTCIDAFWNLIIQANRIN